MSLKEAKGHQYQCVNMLETCAPELYSSVQPVLSIILPIGFATQASVSMYVIISWDGEVGNWMCETTGSVRQLGMQWSETTGCETTGCVRQLDV